MMDDIIITADPTPSKPQGANPFTLFLILVLLLASQEQLAMKRRNRLNPQPDPSIN
ncbi:MAG: hypothetical protein GX489_02745 [Firmicutes bacterium]|nr:hypothetical protein [Bacillota bacterium]